MRRFFSQDLWDRDLWPAAWCLLSVEAFCAVTVFGILYNAHAL